MGIPRQFGPSPPTQEYVHVAPCAIPPAQWGNLSAHEGDDGCELFGQLPEGEDLECRGDSEPCAGQQDELAYAEALDRVQAQASPISGARCINGNVVRSVNAEEEPPSTACRQSTVNAPAGVCLGRAPPGFGKSPG